MFQKFKSFARIKLKNRPIVKKVLIFSVLGTYTKAKVLEKLAQLQSKINGFRYLCCIYQIVLPQLGSRKIKHHKNVRFVQILLKNHLCCWSAKTHIIIMLHKGTNLIKQFDEKCVGVNTLLNPLKIYQNNLKKNY